MKKKALGKGLGVFLPDDYGILKDERYAEVNIEDVEPSPFQPRLRFDPKSIEELARSIKESGIIQPILVVAEGENYKIIVGERRWRAAQLAGLKKVPVLIRSIPREKQLEISLIENLHREDLNPLEVAIVYQKMMEELNCTHEEIADKVGKDRTSVTNYVRLLTLPKVIQDYLAENKMTMGHARAIAALEDPDLQVELAQEIVRKNLTVRDVERLMARQRKVRPAGKKAESDPDLRAVEEDLVKTLGTKVAVSGNRKKGAIKIFYFSLDELNRIYQKIRGGTR